MFGLVFDALFQLKNDGALLVVKEEGRPKILLNPWLSISGGQGKLQE